MTAEIRVTGRFRRLASTVRFRVTLLATAAVLVVLVAAGAAVVGVQQRVLTENLDEALEQGAKSIEAGVVAGQVPRVLGGFGDDDALAQVVTDRGAVVAASGNVAGRPPIAGMPGPSRDALVRTVAGLPTDDSEFRIVSRRVEGPGGLVAVHVAASLDDVEDSTQTLVASLLIAVPVVLAVLAALIWLLVGRTLRPVEAIRAEVAEISGSDLHRRVPDPGTEDEIAGLARTMNAMLDRVEGAAERQRRFVADASHELRTPLARIRTELEVDVAHPDGADLLATHRSVLEEATGLQSLVEDLLHLARSDGSGMSGRLDKVDLDDIVLARAAVLRADGRVSVDVKGVTAAQVVGDAGQLARAVGNLADNAVRHASSRVTFTVAEDDDGVAVVTVSDDGPGIPADQHGRVFERFTSLDDARQGTTGGAGLGLAIARDIVARHGGALAIDSDYGAGARFVVKLPLAPR